MGWSELVGLLTRAVVIDVIGAFRDNEAEARQAKMLTNDEARRIAINVARLSELLGKAERDLTQRVTSPQHGPQQEAPA
jgi:uncharacterized protein YjgD (DUF1641 family)